MARRHDRPRYFDVDDPTLAPPVDVPTSGEPAA
jgi:hypothetical protein